MEWYEFLDKVYDWTEGTIKMKTYQLKDIEPEDLEAVMSYIGFDLSDQLIRKAIRLKMPISREIFEEIEDLMSFNVANELREYLNMERKLNPFENMMKSIENIDMDQLDENVRRVSHEIEDLYGEKEVFPETKVKNVANEYISVLPRNKEIKKKIDYDSYCHQYYKTHYICIPKELDPKQVYKCSHCSFVQ